MHRSIFKIICQFYVPLYHFYVKSIAMSIPGNVLINISTVMYDTKANFYIKLVLAICQHSLNVGI